VGLHLGVKPIVNNIKITYGNSMIHLCYT